MLRNDIGYFTFRPVCRFRRSVGEWMRDEMGISGISFRNFLKPPPRAGRGSTVEDAITVSSFLHTLYVEVGAVFKLSSKLRKLTATETWLPLPARGRGGEGAKHVMSASSFRPIPIRALHNRAPAEIHRRQIRARNLDFPCLARQQRHAILGDGTAEPIHVNRQIAQQSLRRDAERLTVYSGSG